MKIAALALLLVAAPSTLADACTDCSSIQAKNPNRPVHIRGVLECSIECPNGDYIDSDVFVGCPPTGPLPPLPPFYLEPPSGSSSR